MMRQAADVAGVVGLMSSPACGVIRHYSRPVRRRCGLAQSAQRLHHAENRRGSVSFDPNFGATQRTPQMFVADLSHPILQPWAKRVDLYRAV
jgi:hypothetical protein